MKTKWCRFNAVIFPFCVIIVTFDSIILYIFGVYERVLSVVAVLSQPSPPCKGLKQTIKPGVDLDICQTEEQTNCTLEQ